MNHDISDCSNDVQIFSEIELRVDEVRCRVDAAARKSGRVGDDVLIVAVSKYAEPNDKIIEGFLRSKIFDLAENRPQRLLEKVAVWRDSQFWDGVASQALFPVHDRKDETLRWHFIGSLQRNKVRRILPYVSLIHSVDSWRLLETIDRILSEEERTSLGGVDNDSEKSCFPRVISVLLEVHISEDSTKQGFMPTEIFDVLPKIERLKHIRVCGLMGMAGLKANVSEIRRQFASLRHTLEKCQEMFPEFTDMRELSMGMSGDFEIAIEEGATIARLGSILYPNKNGKF